MKPICVSLSTRLDHPAKTVFDWHLSPFAFERLVPPWIKVKVLSKEAGPGHIGSRIVLKVKVGPFWIHSCFQHVEFEDEHHFTDVQIAGPFKFWKHVHKVHSLGDSLSEIVDEIQFIPPLSLFSRFFKKQIERGLKWRHKKVKAELDVLAKYETPPLKILVSGSSGFVGSHLTCFLKGAGHDVYRLVRKAEEGDEKALYWNSKQPSQGVDDFEGFDAVIHLAGKNVSKGIWTDKFKKAIYSSRVNDTLALVEVLAKTQSPPKVFICASATGFYGNRGEEELTENSKAGEGFLAAVCQDWEKATEKVESKGIRRVNTRFGVILSPEGGVLKRLLPTFKLGLGAYFGSGDQWVSWIVLEDVLYALYHALFTHTLQGPVNFCSPEPIREKSLFKELAQALHRPCFIHINEVWCRRLLGEMADEMFLASQRVLPEKLIKSGYQFQYSKPLFSAILGSSDAAD